MEAEPQDVLEQAVDGRRGVVLSVPVFGALRHFKARFAGTDTETIWLQGDFADEGLFEQAIADRRTVCVAFREPGGNSVFASTIDRREPAAGPGDAAMWRVCVRRPERVANLQKRGIRRVVVSPAADLAVKVAWISEAQELATKPASFHEMPVELRDISEGGMGFYVLPREGRPPHLQVSQRLRISIVSSRQELLLEGRVRHYVPGDDLSLRVGLLFGRIETDREGRLKELRLRKIIAGLAALEERWRRPAA